MKKKAFIGISIVIMVAMCFCVSAIAFDGNDYSYDYGGSDWGSSSDWSSSSSSYSSSGSGDFSPATVVVVIIIFIIVFIIGKNGKKKGNTPTTTGQVRSGSGMQGVNVVLPDRTQEIEAIIKADDQNFSASDFIAFGKEVYIDIENAWCKRDLTPVRPVMHENLYNTTERQVQAKIEQGVVYHYESIAINTAYLTSFIRDSQFEYLTMYLNARMIDYQVDEKTGNLIRGDKTTRWDMRYKMKFMRTVGVKTKEEVSQTKGHNCPNCGAPLEITSSGICEYCGSVVTTGQYSWVLSDFTTIRNDTQDEGIRIPDQS